MATIIPCNEIENRIDILKEKFVPCYVLTDQDVDEMADLIYSASLCPEMSNNNPIIEQNNIFKTLTNRNQRQGNANPSIYINQLPTFEITEVEILNIENTYSVLNNNTSTLVTDYYFLKLGKGIYGQNGTPLVNSNFLKYRTKKLSEITSNNSLPPVVENLLGNIDNPDVVGNSSGPFVISSAEDTYFIITSPVSSDISAAKKIYRFVGNEGTYGNGATPFTINDFLLVEDLSLDSSGETPILESRLTIIERLVNSVIRESGLISDISTAINNEFQNPVIQTGNNTLHRFIINKEVQIDSNNSRLDLLVYDYRGSSSTITSTVNSDFSLIETIKGSVLSSNLPSGNGIEILNLTSLNIDNPSVAFNLNTEDIVVNNNDLYVRINRIINSSNSEIAYKLYRFTGGDGTYGNGNTQVSDSDFILIESLNDLVTDSVEILASSITTTPHSDITSTNVQSQLEDINEKIDNFQVSTPNLQSVTDIDANTTNDISFTGTAGNTFGGSGNFIRKSVEGNDINIHADGQLFLEAQNDLELRIGQNSLEFNKLPAGTNYGFTLNMNTPLFTYRSEGNAANFNFLNLTTNRTYTLPDNSGQFALISDIPNASGFMQLLNGAQGVVDGSFSRLNVLGNSAFNMNNLSNINLDAGNILINGDSALSLGTSSSINMNNASSIALNNINLTGNDTSGLIYNLDFSAGYTDRSLVDKAYVDNLVSNSQSSTGLEAIDEGNGIGWRLIGRNPSLYANIGEDAVDFTYWGGTNSVTDIGASAKAGFSHGFENKVSNQNGSIGGVNFGNHVAFGSENNTYGYWNNMTFGTRNTITDGYSSMLIGFGNSANLNNLVGQGFAAGTGNVLSAYWSSAIGAGLIAKSKGVVVVGQGNTDYTKTTDTDNDRPMFIVGNGNVTETTGASYGTATSRSDALVVKKDGEILAPSTEIINITDNKSLVTKEYIDTRFQGEYGSILVYDVTAGEYVKARKVREEFIDYANTVLSLSHKAVWFNSGGDTEFFESYVQVYKEGILQSESTYTLSNTPGATGVTEINFGTPVPTEDIIVIYLTLL